MSMGYCVLVADDHPLLLTGISAILTQSGITEHIGLVEHASGILAQLARIPYDVLVTDYSMPDVQYGDGLQMLGFLRRRYPKLPIIVLTLIDNPALLRVLQRMGMMGIVSKKDPATLVTTAILTVMRGKPYLSPSVEVTLRDAAGLRGRAGATPLSKREIEVLRLYAEGLSVTEIAERLNRSVKTVSGQKQSALSKLGVEHDAGLFRYAFDSGLCTSANRMPTGS